MLAKCTSDCVFGKYLHLSIDRFQIQLEFIPSIKSKLHKLLRCVRNLYRECN